MKPSSAILRKASAFLTEVAETPVPSPDQVYARAAQAAGWAEKLAPRRRFRKVLAFTPRLPKKPNKKLTRKQLVDLVRPEVEKRAGGICECGCERPFENTVQGRATWDEFHGRRHITVQETWMLRADCHQQKTENDPTREEWDGKFMVHCRKHDYPFRKRFYRMPARRRIG